MGALDGKVCVVTGAAQGIGEGIASRFAAEGATVVVSDINEAGAQAVAERLGGTAVACDVTSEEQVANLFRTALDEHGRVDVAVPNAGIGIPKPLTETSLDEWRQVTSVNLDGVFLTMREAAKAMAAGGGGSIVNVASITGIGGHALLCSYSAAKHGVVSLTRTAGIELRDAGIRVNCVCPGYVGTELVESNKATFEAALGVKFDDIISHVQGRLGTTDEVARLVTWLASDAASFSSGAHYVIDGGAVASLL